MRLPALAFAAFTAAALAACGGSSSPPRAPGAPPGPGPGPGPGGPADACVRTGCSGIVCADHEVITTCEYRPEYACYRTATCERQPDGACGWTPTHELAACLASPPQE